MRNTIVLGLTITLAAFAPAQAPDLSTLDIVERSLPDGPVALVDGSPVPRDEFLFLYQAQLGAVALQTRTRNLPDSARVKTALRCLADLVQREVLYQEGLRRGIKVSDADVRAEFDKRIKGLQDQARKHDAQVPSEAEILSRTGESREAAFSDIRRSMTIRRTREAIAKDKKIAVADADIKKFYQENPAFFERPSRVHLSQIFIQPKPNAQKADEAAWETAGKALEKALARIRVGESFEAVARSASEAPDRERGGDMGLLPVAQLPPFILAAVERMKPGDMSEPIRSELGWHLIKMIEKEASESVGLEEARPRIAEALMDSETDAAVYDFCQQILDNPERVRFFLQLERTLAAMPEFADDVSPSGAAPAKKSAQPATQTPKPKAAETPKPAKKKK
jgi:parvulin-like peptidyl-prolyl isomerase